MYIVVSSFNPFKDQLANKDNDFVLSITNEFDVFDVFRQSYDILPGYVYTFQIQERNLSQKNCLVVIFRHCDINLHLSFLIIQINQKRLLFT